MQWGLAALWGSSLTSQGPVPLPCVKMSRACPVMVTGFNQESRSSGIFVVMWQVRGQAGKPVHGSGEGNQVRAQRYRRSTMVAGQNWALEVSLWAEVWIGGPCGQARGQLWLSRRLTLLRYSSDRDRWSDSELNWGSRAPGRGDSGAHSWGLWGLVVLSGPWQL